MTVEFNDLHNYKKTEISLIATLKNLKTYELYIFGIVVPLCSICLCALYVCFP